MKVNIYTSLNGVGLQVDADIIRAVLSEHEVHIIDYVKRQLGDKSDIAFHLEIPRYDDFAKNKQNILIPNPEWFDPKWMPKLKQFDRIFTKTNHATKIFSKFHNVVEYSGFTSLDLYNDRIKKDKTFFHLEGKSMLKNTTSLVEAYKKDHTLPVCYSVSQRTVGRYNNLLFAQRQSIENLGILLNACVVHVCPSQYEGFGHYINEARSCGAVVITTDVPPMNEFIKEKAFLVQGRRAKIKNLVPMHTVDSIELSNAIKRANDMDLSTLIAYGKKNRERFLTNDKEFKERFIKLINV